MKRMLSIFLATVFTGLFSCLLASAQPATDVYTLKDVQNKLQVFSEDWISDNYSNRAVSLKEMVPIKNAKDTVIGYSLSFQENGEACGYVNIMIDGSVTEPVTEYALSGNDLYTDIEDYTIRYMGKKYGIEPVQKQRILNISSGETDEKVIYSDGIPLNYARKVSINGQSRIIKTDGDDVALTIYSQGASVTDTDKGNYDYIKDFNSWPGTVTDHKTVANLSGFVPSPQGSLGAGNNCSPSAVANIAFYFNDARGYSNLIPRYSAGGVYPGRDYDRTMSYARIVNLSGTTSENMPVNIALSALEKYVKERGYKISVNNYWLDLFSDFVRDVKANKPIYTYIVSSTGVTARAVVTLGYVVRTGGNQYLQVFNNWSARTDKCMSFSQAKAKEGYAVNIY